MAKLVLSIITILSFLACGYSSLGVMMVAMLSGASSYSPERAQFNAIFLGLLRHSLLCPGHRVFGFDLEDRNQEA